MEQHTLENVLMDNKPSGYELANCWHFVQRGLETNFFDVYYLKELQHSLRSRRSYNFGSVDFQIHDDELLVNYFGEEAKCNLDDMTHHLHTIVDIYESQSIYA